MLLHVSAIHFGLLQGATNLFEVYRVYAKLSQMFGTIHYTTLHYTTLHYTHTYYIYIIIIQLSIPIYMHAVFIHDAYCQYLNVGISDPV